MENLNCKELRQIAKERKIKYYYKMRKDDLVRALQPVIVTLVTGFARPVPASRPVVQRPIPAPRPVAGFARPVVRPVPAPRPIPAARPVAGFARPVAGVEFTRSILDEPIPLSASSPVLAPEPRLTSTLTTAVRSVASYVSNKFNKLLEWIDPYVPDPIKKTVSNARDGVEKRIKSLKSIFFSKPPIEFQLTNHALRNIIKQFSHQAEGNQQDASVFLDLARDGAMKILRENRNKKVNFVLTCEMSRVSIVPGEETTRTVPFPSKYGIVLEATDFGRIT